MAAQPASPPPPGITPWPGSEPRLPAPERYEEDPGSCHSFLSTCSLVFELQPSSFPTERSRVVYVITLLSGRAREWGTAVWECQTFSQFAQAMRGVFDQSVSGPAATHQLFRIRQGQRPISDYAIEFCILAASAGWGERELHGAYYNGLSDRMLDELSTCDLPTSLEGLVKLTLCVDARLADRRASRHLRDLDQSQERIPYPRQGTTPHPGSARLGTHAGGKDQDLCNRTTATSGPPLCLYCGEAGHVLSTCPVKDNARQWVRGSWFLFPFCVASGSLGMSLMGRDPAPGPGPPGLRVWRQLHLPYVGLMPRHPHGATHQTHVPLRYYWRYAGGGSVGDHTVEGAYLG